MYDTWAVDGLKEKKQTNFNFCLCTVILYEWVGGMRVFVTLLFNLVYQLTNFMFNNANGFLFQTMISIKM